MHKHDLVYLTEDASHDDVIQDKALHTWLTLGAKGTFGL